MDKSGLNQPLPCLPKLVEQPTWGGRYILEMKGLAKDPAWQGKRIGQSYELFGGTKVIVNNQTVLLSALLGEHGQAILGQEHWQRFGPKIPLLLKLTQAKGNSFQLHLHQGVNHPRWKPKAEAWYYLDTGLLSIGVKEGVNWDEYQKTVRAVAKEMERLGRLAKAKALPLEKARSQAKLFIKDHDPTQFVNLVMAKSGEVWDLSAGGLHHSWEENASVVPRGNLVYEIQEDVADDVSSIRCFDKGKIKKDGWLREIHLDDYFRFVDRSPATNHPDAARCKPTMIVNHSGGQVTRLLDSPRFQMELISVKSRLAQARVDLKPNFHHLFAKSGRVSLNYGCDQEFKLVQGRSVLIPANLGQYELRREGKTVAEIIKAYLT